MALVEYRQTAGIAYITLNRPEKLNAVTDELSVELADAVFRLNDDPDAQIGIISGNGRAFCTGADVQQRHLRKREEYALLGRAAGRQGNLQPPFFRSSHSKPVIAAVHGYALGIGLRIALYSDLLVASKGANFQIKEVSRGINGTEYWMLLAQRGAGGLATDVALTGRMWLAEEGYKHGVVNRLAEAGEHVQVAEVLAREILKNPPLAVRAVVETRRNVVEEASLKAHAMRPRTLHLTDDFRESALAFVEKREPVYHGR